MSAFHLSLRLPCSLCFLVAMLLSFNTVAQDKLKVLASASMLADIAQNVGGELIETQTIVPIGGDPHTYTPVPSDAHDVVNADLILINGLTFEGWIDDLVNNANVSAEIVTVSKGVDILTSTQYKNSSDPHAWMDAGNGVIYARNIAAALQKLMPQQQAEIQSNLDAYIAKLQKLDLEIAQMIKRIPESRRVLITSHDAFQYYGRKYGIQLEALMGISTESEAQTSDMMRIVNIIKTQQIPAIFIESTINPKLMRQIAQDNKTVIGGKLYADSLGEKDSPAATYIGMLRYNTETIVNALSQAPDTAQHNTPAGNTECSGLCFCMIWKILAALSILGIIGLIIWRNKK